MTGWVARLTAQMAVLLLVWLNSGDVKEVLPGPACVRACVRAFASRLFGSFALLPAHRPCIPHSLSMSFFISPVYSESGFQRHACFVWPGERAHRQSICVRDNQVANRWVRISKQREDKLHGWNVRACVGLVYLSIYLYFLFYRAAIFLFIPACAAIYTVCFSLNSRLIYF